MNDEKPLTQDSSPNTTKPEHYTNPRPNRNPRGNTIKRDFRGSTPELDGYIFNVHSEQGKKGEYHEVLDRIKAFSAIRFPNSVNQIRLIFDKNQLPTFEKPNLTRDYGPNPDEVDKEGFKEDIREWRKEVKKIQGSKTGHF